MRKLDIREEASVSAVFIAIVGCLFAAILLVVNGVWWLLRKLPNLHAPTVFGAGLGAVGSFTLLAASEEWKEGKSFARGIKDFLDDNS